MSGFSCCSSSTISTFLCRSAAQINNTFHALCCQWNVDLLTLGMFFYILIIWDKRGFSEADNLSMWTVKIACPFSLFVLCDAIDLWPFTWQPVRCQCTSCECPPMGCGYWSHHPRPLCLEINKRCHLTALNNVHTQIHLESAAGRRQNNGLINRFKWFVKASCQEPDHGCKTVIYLLRLVT